MNIKKRNKERSSSNTLASPALIMATTYSRKIYSPSSHTLYSSIARVWQNRKDSPSPLFASLPTILQPLLQALIYMASSTCCSIATPLAFNYSPCSTSRSLLAVQLTMPFVWNRADRQEASAIAALTLRLPTFQTNSQRKSSFCARCVVY